MVKRKRIRRIPKAGGSKKASQKRKTSKTKKTGNKTHQNQVSKGRATMTDDLKPFETFANMTGSVVAENVEQTRKAMNNYLDFLKTHLSASPIAQTEQTKKLMCHAEQNVATAFEFVEKLTRAKDIQDVARIQTEFVQKQMTALNEQAKDIGEVATKAFKDGAT